MPSRHRAFTLVELLVVIGIITVLIAVLLPVLARAREQANRIKCAANLHSMGQALTMYTQQYGCYPGALFATQATEAAVWPARLRTLMGGGKEVFYCPSQDERCRWTDATPEPVIQATGSFLDLGYYPGEPLVHLNAHFSYGYNGGGTEGYNGPVEDQKGLGIQPKHRASSWPGAGDLRASRVKMPAEMIAVADSTADGKDDYVIAPIKSLGYKSAWPGRVHNGGANVLFCDGHVTWYRQEHLLVNEDHATPAPEARMWNNDHRAYGER